MNFHGGKRGQITGSALIRQHDHQKQRLRLTGRTILAYSTCFGGWHAPLPPRP